MAAKAFLSVCIFHETARYVSFAALLLRVSPMVGNACTSGIKLSRSPRPLTFPIPYSNAAYAFIRPHRNDFTIIYSIKAVRKSALLFSVPVLIRYPERNDNRNLGVTLNSPIFVAHFRGVAQSG